jgi:uncharacterized protein
MLIIDCHCHAGKGNGLTGPWDTDAPLSNYCRWATKAGIQKTVLFSAFHSDYAVANQAVARIVQSNPKRFYGFVFLHGERDRTRALNMVGHFVKNHGFCGIKIHRNDARICREICEAARAYNIPILYDPTGEISTVELIAREYPDVNFIIPHLSSFADDWRAQIAFIDQLVRFPNVYTDTSGVRRFDVLLEAYQRAGAKKILFGTDGPWLHPSVELAKIDALPLNSFEKQQILSGNLLKLIHKSPNGLVQGTPKLNGSIRHSQ